MDTVHPSQVDSFRIPDWDRNQRLFGVDGENIHLPPGTIGQYTLIEITAFHGRSLEAKRALYGAIVSKLAGSPDIKSKDITIIIHDVPRTDWGIRGRQ